MNLVRQGTNTYFMAYRDRLRDLLLEGTDDVQWQFERGKEGIFDRHKWNPFLK